VQGEPISKARARFTKRGSKVVSYTPQKTLDGEAAIAHAFREVISDHEKDAEATYAVHAHFINGTRQRRDVDNMVKLILDGLNDVAWPDDNQVTEIAARKSWATKAEARTEVVIYRIGQMNRPTQACLYCSEPFLMYDSWRDSPTGKKYCSPKCCYAHRVAKKERTCEQCAKGFQAWGESHETKYCSKECNYAAKRVDIPCAHCGEVFNIQRCHGKKPSFCSTECRATATKERRSKYFPGTCTHCGGGTTRKEYTRCQPCKTSQEGVVGKAKRTSKAKQEKAV
jgi:Holliday junction resolvase RusA-like endonuclease